MNGPKSNLLSDPEILKNLMNAEVKKIIDSNGTYPNYRYPSYIKEEHLEIIRQGWAKYNQQLLEK